MCLGLKNNDADNDKHLYNDLKGPIISHIFQIKV